MTVEGGNKAILCKIFAARAGSRSAPKLALLLGREVAARFIEVRPAGLSGLGFALGEFLACYAFISVAKNSPCNRSREFHLAQQSWPSSSSPK
jgi:hypothetical protein